MKKLTTTMQRSPVTPEEAAMLQKVMTGVQSCFLAYSLDCEVPVEIDGIEFLTEGTRKEFAEKVRDCNRMVAFVTFIRNGVLADITFCQGKETVEAISFIYDGDTERPLRVP